MSDFESRDEHTESGRTYPLRVACPGVAHKIGGTCLVCDPDTVGTIEVYLTERDVESLRRAANGLRVDASVALRLKSLGLLRDVGGRTVVVGAGRAFIDASASH